MITVGACSAAVDDPSQNIQKSAHDDVIAIYESAASSFVQGMKSNQDVNSLVNGVVQQIIAAFESNAEATKAFCDQKPSSQTLRDRFERAIRSPNGCQTLSDTEADLFISNNYGDFNVKYIVDNYGRTAERFAVPMGGHYFVNDFYGTAFVQLCLGR